MKKTLKVVGILAVLVMTLLTLTGCMNVNFDVQLGKDGSGDVSYIIGYKKSFVESMGMTIDQLKENDTSLEQQQEAIENEGYTVEEYEDDNTYGLIAKKHFDNIEEFSINKELDLEVEEGSDKITFTKEGSKAKYSQDTTIDLTNLLGEDVENDSQMAMAAAMLKQMEMTYKITLPFKAGENNATTVSEDGKTLEWKLTTEKINEIKFEAEESGLPIALYIVIGVCILLVIAAIIGAILNNKGKEKTEPVVEKEPETETKEEPIVETKTEEQPVVEAEPEEKVEEEKEDNKEDEE